MSAVHLQPQSQVPCQKLTVEKWERDIFTALLLNAPCMDKSSSDSSTYQLSKFSWHLKKYKYRKKNKTLFLTHIRKEN